MANENKWKMHIIGNGDKELSTPNVGEEIIAIIEYCTGRIFGEFILSESLKKVKENNQKIEAFKQKLLNEEVQ